MARSRALLCCLGLTLAVALAASGATAQPGRSDRSTFTAEERGRLRRGDLVTRRETRTRGQLRLIGGTSFQVVDAPPELVWRAVMDIDHWRRFVPQVVESRIVEARGTHINIFLRHERGPAEAAYHMNVRHSERSRMAEFRLDKTRPHDIREGWGFFIVTPFGDDRTMVTFGVMADVGTGLVSGLVRPRIHEWMLRVPEQLKHWVEGEGRGLYGG